VWHASRAEIDDKTHARKTSWKHQYERLAMAKCDLAKTRIILYTKPSAQEHTEMMLVLMTAHSTEGPLSRYNSLPAIHGTVLERRDT
jgi:formate-dependent phosphoribosylglycinamide formyltransferase (GAR transformylase)